MIKEENLFYLKIIFEEGLARMVEIMICIGASLDFPLAAPQPIPAQGRWVLSVTVDHDQLQFSHGPEDGHLSPLGPVFDASILSDEHCREGKFTGAFFGLCCQDLTGGRHHADFDWFEYEEQDPEDGDLFAASLTADNRQESGVAKNNAIDQYGAPGTGVDHL